MTHVTATGNSNSRPLDERLADAFARHKSGDVQFAYRVYREVLDQQPNHATALHYLGLLAQQTGRTSEARDLLQRSIEIEPNDPRAHNHLGQILFALNRRNEAIASFEHALALDPAHTDAMNNLANVIKTRDLARAIRLYRRVLELRPDTSHAAYNLANALQSNDEYGEAQQLFERALELDQDNHLAHHNLGVLLEQQGHFDTATAHYLAARRINPKYARSLARLLSLRSYEPDEHSVRDAEAMLTSPRTAQPDQVRLHGGLGKHYERHADYGKAFEHFTAANTLSAAQSASFDIARVRTFFDRIIGTFTQAYFEAARPPGHTTAQPIFIVGLPRSGTTLVEQILGSHPAVLTTGELPAISRIVRNMWPPYPEPVATAEATMIDEWANEYVRELHTVAAGHSNLTADSAVRITDKFPLNFVHLGLIAALFPNARIVHCRRHPLDTGLSCYTERFGLEDDFTTDLRHFGEYFLEHERLMNHWRQVLPIPILEVRYEELVANTEECSRALVAHCGLEWDAACLAFQQHERIIQTPSRWQARQAIYRTSVGRWRNYEKQLAPLRELLNSVD
ncbi:tetratricopeptide repeat-containing sulfotransferase family protein [Steroidobacter sp.]|uniref:tetratricopeptide repeat-containing sulfotransferase family protein n=1 Tax=Steroidobacter sp. TaxID=1978227 RepID=UPI001A389FA6|nr:tetratricopeptide repeat-containing sulfotransferase family protein [Steroidobacter sp.]MBL8271924.1 sulfotransferase [Steroidobacter sp.]